MVSSVASASVLLPSAYSLTEVLVILGVVMTVGKGADGGGGTMLLVVRVTELDVTDKEHVVAEEAEV